MKELRKIQIALLLVIFLYAGCTKYGNGFLSPYLQYAVNEFTIIKGRITSSYSLNTDGSDIPLHVKWTHIYDSSGKVVDDIFTKKYLVSVWTSAYNPLTDKDYASIMAKRGIDSLPPIVVNERNGTIEANPATIYLPAGRYTMDLEASNSAGKQELKKIMTMVITEGKPLETAPEQGAFSNSLSLVGNAAAAVTQFNAVNNPLVDYSVVRYADTPNILTLKITDRYGVPFNPRTGELTKRPNTGLNPNPPFLQNLQDYAPDTYKVSDTAISIRYPLVPFPIASLGNGFNMYYNILATSIHTDSLSAWTSNTPGNFYKGTQDPHYKGMYVDDRYNYYIRVPMRIQVPGAYQITVKILNVTHR